jgi:hypothetical protein
MNRAEGGKPAVKITIVSMPKSKDYVIKKEVVYQSKRFGGSTKVGRWPAGGPNQAGWEKIIFFIKVFEI